MSSHLPTPQQLGWQDLEFGLFVHFGINTFTGREWGDGTEDPALFYPTALDCRQWARVAKEAGMRYAILTAKHHDGFCLWPTETTAHSVKSSPWRDGKGDVVREFVDACREEGILPGLYCSPWDRNAPCYSDPKAYSEFYARQLEELCSNYGPLVQLWFDGAGSEGYTYDWDRIIGTVRRLQPDAVIFQMGDPDIRWGGNELGYGSPDLWTTVDESRLDVLWESPRRELPPQGRYSACRARHDDQPGRVVLASQHDGSNQEPRRADWHLLPLRGARRQPPAQPGCPTGRGGWRRPRSSAFGAGGEIRRSVWQPPWRLSGRGCRRAGDRPREPALVARFEAMEDLSRGRERARVGARGPSGPRRSGTARMAPLGTRVRPWPQDGWATFLRSLPADFACG